ncbi:hypothetical protein GQ602_005294 [Ophiocordyceps camponoti-floridani]|uniref:Uncharacterized protein n=1 Tax=Ophiocordyceps camponoti-floridani TaxID=2030778 RepID=A0A8H4VCV8_9HYPO|nr:hypothetical protein GQ602_005294 [Ophiocordyceps camponoti-floridani]
MRFLAAILLLLSIAMAMDHNPQSDDRSPHDLDADTQGDEPDSYDSQGPEAYPDGPDSEYGPDFEPEAGAYGPGPMPGGDQPGPRGPGPMMPGGDQPGPRGPGPMMPGGGPPGPMGPGPM